MELEAKAPDLQKWIAEIDRYEKQSNDWVEKSEKIIKRFIDKREGRVMDEATKFNALWANVESLLPSLYAQLPAPEVERRNLDRDPAGRVASDVLQKSIRYTLLQHNHSADQVFKQVVLDYLLPGRGTVWMRYVPHFSKPLKDVEEVQDDGSQVYQDAEVEESKDWEEVALDYVHWKDFGHSEARVWSEVNSVWRKVYMDRSELRERFPEDGDEIPLNYGTAQQHMPQNSSVVYDSENMRKSVIYEVWDKKTNSVVWLCKDYKKILDKKDDPLNLEGFFPCPRPLLATITNDSILPIPDYVLYQDQALELDQLSGRIVALNKSIKVAGVYDKNCIGIERLLNEGVENQLIPVDSWSQFSEKGGLKGAVDWMPLQEIVAARNELEEAFRSTKEKMDEITGMNDLKRGNTDAQETATAQQLKSNYSNLRIVDKQRKVQLFMRDTIQIIGQLIAAFFDVKTLKAISGVKLFDTQQQKQQVQQQVQAAIQGGQPVNLPEDIKSMLENPAWDEVEPLLRDRIMLNFRLDIETDSTILVDQIAEKNSRLEFLGSLTQSMEKLVPIAQQTPQLAPLIGDMILFGVRGFRVGRALESRIEQTIEQLEQYAKNPPPQKPDPETLKAQTEQAKLQASIQSEQSKVQAEQQKMMYQAELDKQKTALDAQLEQVKQAAQMEHTKMQNEMENQRAMLQAQMDMKMQEMETQSKLALEQIKHQYSIIQSQQPVEINDNGEE